MTLEGDVGGKAVLADAAVLTEVTALDDGVLDDVDTLEARARLRGREATTE